MVYKKKYGSKSRRTYRRRYKRAKRNYGRLAKRVSKLSRKVAPMVNRGYYKVGWQGTFSSAKYSVVALMDFGNWNSVFGTTTDDQTKRTVYFNKIVIDNYAFMTPNQTATVTYTFVVVSLKKRAAGLVNLGTGDLYTLLEDVHYITSLGQAFVNKEYFNIHGYKRFQIGNYQQPASGGPMTQFGVEKRWKTKIKLNMRVTNPNGNAMQLPCPQDPTQNYFLLMFTNNNSDLIGQSWRGNAIVTCNL